MTCFCPKCDANIELDLAKISNTGLYTPCPTCKSRFWVQRESFINRAFKKEGRIYCVNCDEELGLSHVCSHCSTLLPDYCLIQRTKPPKRKEESSNFSFDFNFTSGHVKSHAASAKSTSGSKALYVKLAIVTVVVVAVVVAGLYIKKSREESAYVTNYVRALYGVKSGVDKSLNTFVKMKENIGYGLSNQEVDAINIAKAEIDSRISKLEKVPDKFSSQNDKILVLHSIYGKLYTLTISPSASSSVDKAMALESDFNKVSLELRTMLTPEFMAELKNVSTRYKNLRIFID